MSDAPLISVEDIEGSMPPVPSEQHEEIANRLIERLNLQHNNDIPGLLSQKGQWGAGLFSLVLFGWWVLLYKDAGSFSSDDTIVLNLSTIGVGVMVIILGGLGAVFGDISGQHGRVFTSYAAGMMFILATIYVLEPLVVSLTSSDLEVAEGLWRSIRLSGLFIGSRISCRWMLDAFMLRWLQSYLDVHEVDIVPPASEAPEQAPIIAATELEDAQLLADN